MYVSIYTDIYKQNENFSNMCVHIYIYIYTIRKNSTNCYLAIRNLFQRNQPLQIAITQCKEKFFLKIFFQWIRV